MPDFSSFVGIDVAMDKLDVHRHPCGEAFTAPNSAAGVKHLLKRLEREHRVGIERYQRQQTDLMAV